MRRQAGQRMTPGQRERAILRGAIAFFAEQGFGGQTRELAARLGITQPLLYRYFPSKEALIERVYEEVFLRRWKPSWEEILSDKALPLERRLTAFYQDYARVILTYEWIRLFMFAGLKGVGYNARYFKTLRERVFSRVVSHLRVAQGLPSVEEAPVTEAEYELVWGLHAAIFYVGVRKWIYGLPIPKDIEADIATRVAAFLEGVPRTMSRLLQETTRKRSPRARGLAAHAYTAAASAKRKTSMRDGAGRRKGATDPDC